jgi:Raf kinase inhibitor-like YbhB/YbcL family protein
LKIFLIITQLVLFSGYLSNQPEQEIQTDEDTIMEQISISSDAFKASTSLPVEHTCDGEDRSPAFSWNTVPADTQSIALIVDDPDAPGKTWVHWVIYNIPANTTRLPAAVPKNKILDDGSLQGKNDFGRIGYNGPCPPPGKPHRYFFKVYALDTTSGLKNGATKSQLEAAMSGHILAQGEMIGKYGR